MFAFIVLVLALCEEVGIDLLGRHCSLPVQLHFGDRRPLVACVDGETGKNESQLPTGKKSSCGKGIQRQQEDEQIAGRGKRVKRMGSPR